MSKFKVSSKPAGVSAPITAEQFAAGAAMVQSQTGGRPLKPIRVNFDLDPALHHRLQLHALQRGKKVAQLIRELIVREIAGTG